MAKLRVLLVLLGLPAKAEAANATNALVIGGGFAGLAAAVQLCEDGYDVTVLEARARLGGRAHTTTLRDIPLEQGTGWLLGAEPVRNSLQRLALLSSVPTARGDDGTTRSWRFDNAPALATHLFEERWKSCSDSFYTQLRLRSRWRNETTDMQMEFDEWVPARSHDANDTAGCLSIVRLELADLRVGARPKAIGVRHWREGSALVGPANLVDMLPKAAGKPAGGHSGLADALRDRLVNRAKDSRGAAASNKCRVETGVEVTDVVLGSANASVELKLANGSSAYAAFVINTLPLGVLKHGDVAFTPDLSAEKRAALDRLGVGLVNKIQLVYSTNFWAGKEGGDAAMLRPVVLPAGAISTDAGGPPLPASAPITFWNAAKFDATSGGRAAVTALVGGDLAEKWEADFNDADLVARVDAMFRALFDAPSAVTLDASNASRWRSDRFSRGAFSFLPPKATPADREVLCAPEAEAIYWAGEHCSREYPGTSHGAYDSGVAAARLARGQHPLPGQIRYEGVVAASVVMTLFACGCFVAIGVLVYRRLAARKAEAAAAARADAPKGAAPVSGAAAVARAAEGGQSAARRYQREDSFGPPISATDMNGVEPAAVGGAAVARQDSFGRAALASV